MIIFIITCWAFFTCFFLYSSETSIWLVALASTLAHLLKMLFLPTTQTYLTKYFTAFSLMSYPTSITLILGHLAVFFVIFVFHYSGPLILLWLFLDVYPSTDFICLSAGSQLSAWLLPGNFANSILLQWLFPLIYHFWLRRLGGQTIIHLPYCHTESLSPILWIKAVLHNSLIMFLLILPQSKTGMTCIISRHKVIVEFLNHSFIDIFIAV